MKRVLTFIIISLLFMSPVYGEDKVLLELRGPDKVDINSGFKVDLFLNNINNVYGLQIKIKFNKEYIKPVSSSFELSDEIVSSEHFVASNSLADGEGVLTLTLLGRDNVSYISDTVGYINFKAIKSGDTDVTIENSSLLTREGNDILHYKDNLAIEILKANNHHDDESKDKKGDSGGKAGGNEDTQNSNGIENDGNIDSVDESEDSDTIHLGDNMGNMQAKEFKDIEGSWAEDYINSLASMGLVDGISEDRFSPNSLVTRAEICKLLALAIGYDDEYNELNELNELNEFEEISFNDRDSIPYWSKQYILSLVHKGVISGYDDNTFRPNNQLTRAEIAVMISRALGKNLNIDSNVELFSDHDDIPNWAIDGVYMLKSLGIISGYEDGSFNPNGYITRAEMCKVVYNMLKIL